MTPLNLPPPSRVSIGYVQGPNGPLEMLISPEWARYFETLTERAGGVTGAGTTDLAVSAFEDAGIEESKAEMIALARSLDQSTRQEPETRLDVLETQVTEALALIGELRRDITGLQQGYSL